MIPSQLYKTVVFCIKNKLPLLIKGSPGLGKTDIVHQACDAVNAKLLVSHPVVSDPTDYKGLPFPEGDHASFLPFGDLKQLIEAKKPLVFFLDDLGQAQISVQAAAMNLLLGRQINSHKVSDKVTFIAATNRRQDKAGVQGILEPVKSRFISIVELEKDVDDWVCWALKNNMPTDLIAFIRFRPDLLNNFKPTADLINSPCPRTVAAVGTMINDGLFNEFGEVKAIDKSSTGQVYEMISGAVGEAFAAEYLAFRRLYRELPDIEYIIMHPETADVPQDPATLYALCGALAKKSGENNFDNILTYAERIQPEFQVYLMKDATALNANLMRTRAFNKWAVSHKDIYI